MTPQEVFDKVAKHLLTQNAESILGNGCAYRGTHGRMCAVGCLIPDELYDPKMERKNVMHVASKFPEVKQCGITEENMPLLAKLQQIHDLDPTSVWRQELAKVAQRFKLDPKVLEI